MNDFVFVYLMVIKFIKYFLNLSSIARKVLVTKMRDICELCPKEKKEVVNLALSADFS